jgi:hypothetical protein
LDSWKKNSNQGSTNFFNYEVKKTPRQYSFGTKKSKVALKKKKVVKKFKDTTTVGAVSTTASNEILQSEIEEEEEEEEQKDKELKILTGSVFFVIYFSF